MRRGSMWRTMLAGALLVGVLGACGDDDDEVSSTGTTTGASATGTGGEGENTLGLEQFDYGYKITGKLSAGLATINSSNTGKEWHMAGFGLLKPGKTAEQLVEALKASGGPGGGEGGEQQDPTAEFIEEELGTPGHVLQPGQSTSFTVDVLKPGNYVILCFIPTEGEGVPHIAKGMVNSFEVSAKKSAAKAPKEDFAITLPDDAEPAGLPTEMDGGKRTFKLTASGTKGKDFFIGQLKEGKVFADFDGYFEENFEREGGPPKGVAKLAPGTLFGSTFEIATGQTIWMTVDLTPGETYFVNTTNADDEGGGEGEGEGPPEGEDKFVKVKVT